MLSAEENTGHSRLLVAERRGGNAICCNDEAGKFIP